MDFTVTIHIPDDLARRERIKWSTLPDHIRSAVQKNMLIGAVDASRVNVRYRGVLTDEEREMLRNHPANFGNGG